MGALKEKQLVSEDEFWALVENSTQKLELIGGRVYAMAAGEYVHSRLIARLSMILESGLEGKRCSPCGSEFFVKIEGLGDYLIPDNAVHCEDARFEKYPRRALFNPVVVFEVLSPRTERFDRGDKFELFASLPSLQDYLLISAKRVGIEHFTRRGEEWILRRYSRPEDVVSIASIEVEISLERLYRGLDVPIQLTLLPPTENDEENSENA